MLQIIVCVIERFTNIFFSYFDYLFSKKN